ncbi:hypothetical protein ACFE04_012154 [Oxalis oulophora]
MEQNTRRHSIALSHDLLFSETDSVSEVFVSTTTSSARQSRATHQYLHASSTSTCPTARSPPSTLPPSLGYLSVPSLILYSRPSILQETSLHAEVLGDIEDVLFGSDEARDVAVEEALRGVEGLKLIKIL